MKSFAICFLILSILVHPIVIRAQWQLDGTPLSTAAGRQAFPTIVSDGVGGAIVAWNDLRSGTNWDVYARRVNAGGAVQWTANGVGLSTAPGDQASPVLVSDGAGGAIATWLDTRSGNNDIYAQRVSASGTMHWAANGVGLCTDEGWQYNPASVSDGVGGAIVAWEDLRTGNNDIYAQRVSASGMVQWTADGVALCTSDSVQTYPVITSDGVGGAIVMWSDNRGGNYDIYAQQIGAYGSVQWTANGIALCTAAGNQFASDIVSDGAGGAIVSWVDGRSGAHDIFAQRIDASGAVQWTADGVALCTADSVQTNLAIVSDGAGGAIATWNDRRGGNWDIYARRVSASGSALWTDDGVVLCNAANAQYTPRIASDGAGGAIVIWYDWRNGINAIAYAQRVNAYGSVQWTANGDALCAAASNQFVSDIASDGAGGAILTWEDTRSDVGDLYAQRVGPHGQIPTAVGGTAPSSLIVGNNRPNPFSLGTAIDVTLQHESPLSVDVYDVAGHRVRAIDMGLVGAGPRQLQFDGLDDHESALPSGIYFFRVHAAGETVTRKMVIER